MHHVFDIPELVLEIISWLSLPDRVHFGLASRSLWQVAVSEIWVSINRRALNTLLQVDHGGDHNETAWKPAIQPARPLLEYAAHTRHLSLLDTVREPAHRGGHIIDLDSLMTVIHKITTVIQPLPFMHRLESLALSLSSHSSVEPAIRLLSPRLKHLKMKVHLWEKTKLNMLTTLVEGIRQCQKIVTLEVDISAVGFPRDVLDASLGDVIAALPTLRQLRCRGSSQLLLTAGQCEALERLVIEGYEFGLQDFMRSSNTHPAFPSLIALCIDSIVPLSGPTAPLLLGMVSSSKVRELHFKTQAREASMIEDACHLIAAKWARTLKKLHVQFDITRPADSIYEAIRPLFGCRSLEAVLLHSGGHLDLSDDMYRTLSLAWPQLSALSVDGGAKYRTVDHVPLPTPLSLAILSKNCPRLRYICLSVNFDTNQGDSCMHALASSCSVRKVDASLSICNHPASTANRLQALFPELKALAYRDACLREVGELMNLPVLCEDVDVKELLDVQITFPLCCTAE